MRGLMISCCSPRTGCGGARAASWYGSAVALMADGAPRLLLGPGSTPAPTTVGLPSAMMRSRTPRVSICTTRLL